MGILLVLSSLSARGQETSIELHISVNDAVGKPLPCRDLHIHRSIADIELLMKAEDLHVAPLITWWNQRNDWTGHELPQTALTTFDSNRLVNVMAGEDERGGGALLYFHLAEPLAIANAEREFPSPLLFADEARKTNNKVWIDVEKPFWWDSPTWIACGKIDSIGIANNYMYSIYGDVMERTIFNGLFSAQSPDGRRMRYFTAFDGPRIYWTGLADIGRPPFPIRTQRSSSPMS